jgi:hypothetical protein
MVAGQIRGDSREHARLAPHAMGQEDDGSLPHVLDQELET